MEAKELYAEYQIPVALRAAVVPVETLRATDPRAAEEALADPPAVRPLVEGYAAALLLGITRDYVEKRGFDDLKSLRELIQNALDETELTLGRPDVAVEADALGTWIVDRGRGLKAEGLLLGGSDKACWMRGYYGEGLKLAAAHFVMRGTPVYVFAGDHAFKFAAMPRDAENPRLVVLLGRARRPREGTAVLLHGFAAEGDVLERLVSFHNPALRDRKVGELRSASEGCPHERPSAVYDYPDLLYIRNMLVGPSHEVAKRKSLLSYDLWWFRLDVSRTLTTYSVPDLFREAAKVFDASEQARRVLARKLVESGMLKAKPVADGVVVTFNPIFAIFEGHLFVYSFPRGMLDAMLAALGLEARKPHVVRATGEEDLTDATKRGLVPFVVSPELSEEFRRIPALADRSDAS